MGRWLVRGSAHPSCSGKSDLTQLHIISTAELVCLGISAAMPSRPWTPVKQMVTLSCSHRANQTISAEPHPGYRKEDKS
jgi:hypothetical protein